MSFIIKTNTNELQNIKPLYVKYSSRGIVSVVANCNVLSVSAVSIVTNTVADSSYAISGSIDANSLLKSLPSVINIENTNTIT